jgi:hypothetical protein
MVATERGINGSLEEGLHILEAYLSKCNNECMWKEKPLRFNDSVHETEGKRLKGKEKYEPLSMKFLVCFTLDG